jgi:hypothetical protein
MSAYISPQKLSINLPSPPFSPRFFRTKRENVEQAILLTFNSPSTFAPHRGVAFTFPINKRLQPPHRLENARMEGKVHKRGREMLGSQNRGPRPRSVKVNIIHDPARVNNLAGVQRKLRKVEITYVQFVFM